jgi:hypothetical protein
MAAPSAGPRETGILPDELLATRARREARRSEQIHSEDDFKDLFAKAKLDPARHQF